MPAGHGNGPFADTLTAGSQVVARNLNPLRWAGWGSRLPQPEPDWGSEVPQPEVTAASTIESMATDARRAESLERLPLPYAVALRLRDAGVADDMIAERVGVDRA